MWYMKEGQRYTERKNNRKKRVNWTSVFAALWFWLCSNRASGPSVAVLMKRALQPHSSLTVSSNHFSSPHSPPARIIRLYLLVFPTPLAPSLPVPCHCDPCVVLLQRLAEAAERGNIYRSVKWGWALLLYCTLTVPRQSLLQQQCTARDTATQIQAF